MTLLADPRDVDRLAQAVMRFGIDAASIRTEFRVTLPAKNTFTADLVGFADNRRTDISTSLILAHILRADGQRDRVLDSARALATPLAILESDDSWQLWAPGAEHGPTVIDTVNIGQSFSVAEKLSRLGTESLLAAKSQHGGQMPLFSVDIGFLDRARADSRRVLADYVTILLAEAKSGLLASGEDDEVASSRATRLVIGALAVCALRDKKLLDNTVLQSLTSGVAIDLAGLRYPQFFRWLSEVSPLDLDLFEQSVGSLTDWVSLEGLEPPMVSDVYEETLTTALARRDRGIYYTPPNLARRILDGVPFEDVPPSERTLLDPACGSGSLLLASIPRLAATHLPALTPSDTGRYASQLVTGFDIDQFAAEVARLALMLSDLPESNSWEVEHRDTLHTDTGYVTPKFIVSNPPWRDPHAGGPRRDMASVFLGWMLDTLATDGYIACVMPKSWLTANSARDSRANFRAQAEILDIWQLPESVFQSTSASSAPAVLIARKRAPGQQSRRLALARRVSHERVEDFLSKGKSVDNYLLDPEEGPATAPLSSGFLSRFARSWDGPRLQDLADVRNGRPHKPGRPTRRRGTAMEISSLDDLPSFGFVEARTPVVPETDFDGYTESYAEFCASPKVLVTAKSWGGNNPWRVKAAVDISGALFRELMHGLIPRDSETWGRLSSEERLWALCGLAGSMFGSRWILESNASRNYAVWTFKDMPVPRSATQLRRIARYARTLNEALLERDIASEEEGDAARYSASALRAARQLDSVVLDALDMPPLLREALVQSYAGALSHEGLMRVESSDEPTSIQTSLFDLWATTSFGEVVDIDADRGLRLWVSGVTSDEGDWVGLPTRFKGRLTFVGADFRVEELHLGLVEARYELHESNWVDSLDPNDRLLA